MTKPIEKQIPSINWCLDRDATTGHRTSHSCIGALSEILGTKTLNFLKVFLEHHAPNPQALSKALKIHCKGLTMEVDQITKEIEKFNFFNKADASLKTFTLFKETRKFCELIANTKNNSLNLISDAGSAFAKASSKDEKSLFELFDNVNFSCEEGEYAKNSIAPFYKISQQHDHKGIFVMIGDRLEFDIMNSLRSNEDDKYTGFDYAVLLDHQEIPDEYKSVYHHIFPQRNMDDKTKHQYNLYKSRIIHATSLMDAYEKVMHRIHNT